MNLETQGHVLLHHLELVDFLDLNLGFARRLIGDAQKAILGLDPVAVLWVGEPSAQKSVLHFHYI